RDAKTNRVLRGPVFSCPVSGGFPAARETGRTVCRNPPPPLHKPLIFRDFRGFARCRPLAVFLSLPARAKVAKLVDAPDLGSGTSVCGFKSLPSHQISRPAPDIVRLRGPTRPRITVPTL